MLTTIPTSLSTREIAILIWAAISFVFALCSAEIRSSLMTLVKGVLHNKILSVILAMLIYIGCVSWGMHASGLLGVLQLKSVFIWALFVGFVSVVKAVGAVDNRYFVNALKNVFKVAVLAEFVINFYTFNLVLEVIMVPVLFFIGVLSASGKPSNESNILKKISNTVLGALGVVIFIYFSVKVFRNPTEFFNINTAREILLPIVLTITFLPFIFTLSLVAKYEQVFNNFNLTVGSDKAYRRFLKKKVFLRFGFNLKELAAWSSELISGAMGGKQDFCDVLSQSRTEKFRRPEECSYMEDVGLKTGVWKRVQKNEFEACSIPKNIDLPEYSFNLISYCVKGTKSKAKEMDLKLFLYSKLDNDLVRQEFVKAANLLMYKAFHHDLPGMMVRAIRGKKDCKAEVEEGDLQVQQIDWTSGAGCDLHFIIKLHN